MVKIYSKTLARTPIKTHKGDGKGPLFVNKLLFWWSASITLDNSNDALTDFKLAQFAWPDVFLFFSVLNIFTTVLPVGSLLGRVQDFEIFHVGLVTLFLTKMWTYNFAIKLFSKLS